MLQIDLGSWSPGGRFNRLRQEIDDLLYAEIQARQASRPNRTDIPPCCWRHGMRQGKPMSHEELRDELMTLLLAGHETGNGTSVGIGFTIARGETKLLAELEAMVWM